MCRDRRRTEAAPLVRFGGQGRPVEEIRPADVVGDGRSTRLLAVVVLLLVVSYEIATFALRRA